jgi:hypothetical protein
MANGQLLAAPEWGVSELDCILKPHQISCELQYQKECDHGRRIVDLTVLVCATDRTQVEVAIEKRRGRNGADVLVIPERRSIFRRDLESESLAERIVKILCEHGASDDPDARCDDLA